MTEEFKDMIGLILWYAIFMTPLITIPFAWKVFKIRNIYRIMIGLFLAFVLSYFLYFISLAIIFRDGMGPG
ncbi:MAG: hypothetical protein SFU99_18775 [Saprospiraceae bacterium]|nr:hypothetical protein [Saprospiraceae bacterium]